jgi:hypothetical protein
MTETIAVRLCGLYHRFGFLQRAPRDSQRCGDLVSGLAGRTFRKLSWMFIGSCPLPLFRQLPFLLLNGRCNRHHLTRGEILAIPIFGYLSPDNGVDIGHTHRHRRSDTPRPTLTFSSSPGQGLFPLTEVLREGAQTLLVQAVRAEIAAFLSCHADKLTDDGRQRLVRHGYLPERTIMTGLGPVAVRCPRVRDRVSEGGERIRFSSAILPPYARRSKSCTADIGTELPRQVSPNPSWRILVAFH